MTGLVHWLHDPRSVFRVIGRDETRGRWLLMYVRGLQGSRMWLDDETVRRLWPAVEGGEA